MGIVQFIFFGWHRRSETEGVVCQSACPHCANETTLCLVRERRWFRLYFVPILPVGSKEWFMVCPICGYGQPIQPGFVSHCRHMIAQTHNYREGNLPREVYLEEVEAFYNNGPFPDTAVSVSKSVEVECRYCGADLQRQTNYCRECGASLTEPAQRS